MWSTVRKKSRYFFLSGLAVILLHQSCSGLSGLISNAKISPFQLELQWTPFSKEEPISAGFSRDESRKQLLQAALKRRRKSESSKCLSMRSAWMSPAVASVFIRMEFCIERRATTKKRKDVERCCSLSLGINALVTQSRPQLFKSRIETLSLSQLGGWTREMNRWDVWEIFQSVWSVKSKFLFSVSSVLNFTTKK